MVKASSQIEKELGLLQQRTEEMAITLDPIYDGYLNALAEASKQQLMSAAYHLCTQAYPDKFLTLSWKERNELQKALQVLAAQIQPQLQERRTQAKQASRRPQRSSGLGLLHRLLESRSSSSIVHASEKSSDDLLEKLSEFAQLDQHSDQPSDKKLGRRKSDQSFDVDKSETVEDWEGDIPTAEDDDETDLATSESFFNQSSQRKDNTFTAVDLEDMDFSESVETSNEDLDDLGNSLEEDEELDFEMEVPAAEQRLTISDEEDLLTALEGLARHSDSVENSEGNDERPLAPAHLFRQQVLVERGIREVFKAVSEEVNELLQKAKVMPSFPKALMAAATDPQGIGEPVNSVPNVVRVSVRVMHGEVKAKSDDGHEDEQALPGSRSGKRRRRLPSKQAYSTKPSRSKSNRPPSPRHLVPHDIVEIETLPELAVISLQLSEVAFSDPTVSAWWTRLRKELSTLKRLGTRYTKTQRSLETSQAEDAWRSSWIAQDDG